MTDPTTIGNGMKFETRYITGLKGFTVTRGNHETFNLVSQLPEFYYSPEVDLYNWLCSDYQCTNNSSTEEQANATINKTCGDTDFIWSQAYKSSGSSGLKWQSDRAYTNICNGETLGYAYTRILYIDDNYANYGSVTLRSHLKIKLPPINCQIEVSFLYAEDTSGSHYVSWGSGPSHTSYAKIDGTSIETTRGTYTWDIQWLSPDLILIDGDEYAVTDGILEVIQQTTGSVTLSDHGSVTTTVYVKFNQEMPPDLVDLPVNV